MLQLFIEACLVGVVLIIIGVVVTYLIKIKYDNNLPDVCENWNKNNIMELSLFLIGFCAHIFFEIANINKLYCKYGYACIKQKL